MKAGHVIVGLDVHKNSIVAAVLPPEHERVTETIRMEHAPEAVARFVRRVARRGETEFVYEAGPCGYDVQRQLVNLGYRCTVIAPGLTPVRPGDRVKTDRRDAEKLARLYRAGELTAIRVPTAAEEAARDLVRSREDAVTDRLRARHRLGKFLLRQGRVYRETKAWGVKHRAWLKAQRFEWAALHQTFEAYVRTLEEAEARLQTLDQQVEDLAHHDPSRIPVQYLRCLKGIDTLSALTVAVEAQEFRRFERAPALMSFTGLVSAEHSSGEKVRRGGITKVGKAHLRRVLVEAAWCYRQGHVASPQLTARRTGCPAAVLHIARKAQDRVRRKVWRMLARHKAPQVAVVAAAREWAGFVWAVAQQFPVAPAI
jgi:transposase